VYIHSCKLVFVHTANCNRLGVRVIFTCSHSRNCVDSAHPSIRHCCRRTAWPGD
jgi:hypothetical protein